MSIDIEQLASPIGFLPAVSKDEELKGSTLNSVAHIHATQIVLTVDVNWPDEDFVKGLDARIEHGDDYQELRITAYNPLTRTVTVTPALTQEYPAESDFILRAIPFCHKLEKFDPRVERNKDASGTVGSGIIKNVVTEAAEEVNISLQGLRGTDYFNDNIYSSMIAHACSSDGKFNRSLCSVLFRGVSQTPSDAPPMTIIWQAKSGEPRVVHCALITNYEESFEEDSESLVKVNFVINGARRSKVFPTNVLPPLNPYTYPILRAHGSSLITFKHKSMITTDFTSNDNSVIAGNVYGFAEGDEIIIENEKGEIAIANITDIDESTGEISIDNPIGVKGYGMRSWIYQAEASAKDYSLVTYEFKINSGQTLSGDVSKNKRYRTNIHAGAFEITAKAVIKRYAMTFFNIQEQNASYTRLIVTLRQYDEKEQQISLLELEYAITNQISEPLTDKADIMVDELDLVLVDINQLHQPIIEISSPQT